LRAKDGAVGEEVGVEDVRRGGVKTIVGY